MAWRCLRSLPDPRLGLDDAGIDADLEFDGAAGLWRAREGARVTALDDALRRAAADHLDEI